MNGISMNFHKIIHNWMISSDCIHILSRKILPIFSFCLIRTHFTRQFLILTKQMLLYNVFKCDESANGKDNPCKYHQLPVSQQYCAEIFLWFLASFLQFLYYTLSIFARMLVNCVNYVTNISWNYIQISFITREKTRHLSPLTQIQLAPICTTPSHSLFTQLLWKLKTISQKIKRLFSQHDFSTFLVITADFALFFLRLASKSVGRGKLSGAIGEECIYSSLKLLVKNQYILSNSRSRYRPSRVGVSLSLSAT